MRGDVGWFNWSLRVSKRVWLITVFNRRATEGHWWGLSVLQIRNRHLLYIGNHGLRVLFLGSTP